MAGIISGFNMIIGLDVILEGFLKIGTENSKKAYASFSLYQTIY